MHTPSLTWVTNRRATSPAERQKYPRKPPRQTATDLHFEA